VATGTQLRQALGLSFALSQKPIGNEGIGTGLIGGLTGLRGLSTTRQSLTLTPASVNAAYRAIHDQLTFDLAASGLSAAVGRADESDTAAALARRKTKVTGLASETDSAQALTRRKVRAAGLASESDSAASLARRKARLAGLANETDTAFERSAGPRVGRATEADTASALARRKIRAAGLASETDSAQALARRKARPVGLAVETSAAFALARRKTRPAGLATVTDIATAQARRKIRAAGRADETDTAFALTSPGLIVLPVGRADETDSAFALSRFVASTGVPRRRSSGAPLFYVDYEPERLPLDARIRTRLENCSVYARVRLTTFASAGAVLADARMQARLERVVVAGATVRLGNAGMRANAVSDWRNAIDDDDEFLRLIEAA